MTSYAGGWAYCSSCRKYIREFGDALLCPYCGHRLKTRPNRKKTMSRRLYYITDQGYRCLNCKSILTPAGDSLKCSNELCGEQYPREEITVEI